MSSRYSKIPASVQLAKMRAALLAKKAMGTRRVAGGASTRNRRGYKRSVYWPNRIRGKGDYFIMPGESKRTENMFDGFGSHIGRAVFGPAGRYLGGAAHALFKKLTGFGDYKVKSNSIAMGTDPPAFASMGRGTIVRHREYLQDIITSSSANTFNIQTFPINAAQTLTFPWLSTIADSFEQYCIRGMVFEFKSMSADALNSTNTALGSVIMATQYNSANPAFTSKAQMENHEFCTSGKPSTSFLHPIECARGETPISCLYTRPGPVPSGTDIRLYDLGQFNIATTGFQGTSVNIGELWISYDVELLKPQMNVGGDDEGGTSDHYTLGSGITTSAYFGTTPTLQSGSNLGTIMAAGISTVTFPVIPTTVNYFIYYQVTGTSATLTSGLDFGINGSATLLPILNGGADEIVLPSGSTCAIQTGVVVIQIPAATTGSFTIDAGTLPTSPVRGDLMITQLSSSQTMALTSLGKDIAERKLGSACRRKVKAEPLDFGVPADGAHEGPDGEEEPPEPTTESEDEIEAYRLLIKARRRQKATAEAKATRETKEEKKTKRTGGEDDDEDSSDMVKVKHTRAVVASGGATTTTGPARVETAGDASVIPVFGTPVVAAKKASLK